VGRGYRAECQGLWRRAGFAFAAVALLVLAPLSSAVGHVVHGASTLHELVAGAEWVVRARIEALSDRIVLDETGVRRPIAEARVLEVLKAPAGKPAAAAEGSPQAGASVRFAQHGHGVAEYEVGEEAIVFLLPLSRSPELAQLAADGSLRFVSLQEHDDKVMLTEASREAWVSALRAYVALASKGKPEERFAAFRRVTLAHLTSPEERIATSAAHDLLRAAEAPLVRAEDVPALEAIVASPETPIGVRLAILADLVRRGLVDAAPRFQALLRATRGHERVAAVHAAGAHPSPPVTGELARILAGEDAAAAEAAAVALGAPGHAASVPALAEALRDGPARLRLAAVRGLGGIATPEARGILAEAASSHPDPQTRRRAEAELRVLRARGRTAGEPSAAPAPSTGAAD
jgi:hypothetical protein